MTTCPTCGQPTDGFPTPRTIREHAAIVRSAYKTGEDTMTDDDIRQLLRDNAVRESYLCLTDRFLEPHEDMTATQAIAWAALDRMLTDFIGDEPKGWHYAMETVFVAHPREDGVRVGLLYEYEFGDEFDPSVDHWQEMRALVPAWAEFNPVGEGAEYTANNCATLQVFFPAYEGRTVLPAFNLQDIEKMAAALHAMWAEPPEPASWSRQTNISYDGVPVVGLFLWSDINSPDNPNDMKDDRRYYEFRNEPYFFMGAMQLRDMIDNMMWVDERVGAPQFHIYLELKGQHDLVKMEDYNLFTD